MQEEHGTLFADDLVGGYMVERFLGFVRGYEVYSVFHPQLEIHRTLKVVRPELVRQHPEFKDHFLKEIQTLMHLRHRSMIPICEAGTDDIGGGVLYYTIDQFPGKTLTESIGSGKGMKETQAIRIIVSTADVLRMLEENGRSHRDITPDNIILHEQRGSFLGEPGISSGGNAELEDALREASFSAPELLRSPETADIRADIYSLGKVWFFLLTGRLPDGAMDPRKLVPELQPDTAELVRRMLAPDPAGRPGSSKTLMAELVRLPGGMEFGNPELQKLAAEEVNQTVADRTRQMAETLQKKQVVERKVWRYGLIAVGVLTVILLIRSLWLCGELIIKNRRYSAGDSKTVELKQSLADLAEQEKTQEAALQKARGGAEALEQSLEKLEKAMRGNGK